MKHAVIETGGKQYLVRKDDVLRVELLADQKKVEFEPLLVFDDKGAKVGQPTVKGAKVSAEVVEAKVAGDKLKIIRYKPKKRVRKITGHRQKYTEIKITAIN